MNSLMMIYKNSKINCNIGAKERNMSVEKELSVRSGNQCELCSSTEGLNVYGVSPKSDSSVNNVIHTCAKCTSELSLDSGWDSAHWRCLNESMWSEVPAVKVVSWRMLNCLKSEGWPVELLEMMYMEDETLEWAKDGFNDPNEDKIVHRDSNGVILESGDSVVIIKDLNVKGSSLVAKRGTAVRNITLVHDNPEHIEGKVEGQRIVILTKYVKK